MSNRLRAVVRTDRVEEFTGGAGPEPALPAGVVGEPARHVLRHPADQVRESRDHPVLQTTHIIKIMSKSL